MIRPPKIGFLQEILLARRKVHRPRLCDVLACSLWTNLSRGKFAMRFKRLLLLALFSNLLGVSLASAQWQTSGSNIYNTNSGNVGVGTTTPGAKLDIESSGTNSFALRVLNSSGNYIAGIWEQTFGAATLELDNAGGTSVVQLNTTGNSYINGANVGIGTISPTRRLHVAGDIQVDGAIYFGSNSSPQSGPFIGVLSCGDFAESVRVSEDRSRYEPGDILVIDPANPNRFLKSAEPYSAAVSGIFSTKPGILGRAYPTNPQSVNEEVPMAMIGIVPAKVSAENGPIRPGDLLVTSGTVGYAMKGTDRSRMLGAVVGKALEPLESGTGVIQVLVTLQ